MQTMARTHDHCERYAETAFGRGECSKQEQMIKEQTGVSATVTVACDGDASECPFFKKWEKEENE